MVAWRSLGKGEDMDKLVLYTAVWLITKPKEMEEQEVVAMETEEPGCGDLHYQTTISYKDSFI